LSLDGHLPKNAQHLDIIGLETKTANADATFTIPRIGSMVAHTRQTPMKRIVCYTIETYVESLGTCRIAQRKTCLQEKHLGEEAISL
jgi:hypothetical protein